MPIVPAARALYLCDLHVGYNNGKVDLYGLFNAIRPKAGYPYERSRFCVFAQLINGLGKTPFVIGIRPADSDVPIWSTDKLELDFRTRLSLVQMAVTIEGCRFEALAFMSSSCSARIHGSAIPN